jgi:hypothetical protein
MSKHTSSKSGKKVVQLMTDLIDRLILLEALKIFHKAVSAFT